jgi:hypothetical protein
MLDLGGAFEMDSINLLCVIHACISCLPFMLCDICVLANAFVTCVLSTLLYICHVTCCYSFVLLS